MFSFIPLLLSLFITGPENKPLELTIQSNLGKTKDERFQKLIELRDLCIELHMLEWEGPSEMHGPLLYKF